ncbi:MAG: hypothetical protein SFT91_01775 [Rickettsiaceae bacterium]|nr:hypothetical protein [Rickettsiaceae bacterium]
MVGPKRDSCTGVDLIDLSSNAIGNNKEKYNAMGRTIRKGSDGVKMSTTAAQANGNIDRASKNSGGVQVQTQGGRITR